MLTDDIVIYSESRKKVEENLGRWRRGEKKRNESQSKQNRIRVCE